MAGKITKTDAQWRAELTPEQYRVLREHGTERAGTSPLNNEKASGMYKCAGCGADLFPSDTKYDSGTGWPSYYAPTSPDAVSEHVDKSWFSTRTEVRCAKCDGHLGHVFPDGPDPTGLRYCMNGAALKFNPGKA
ncbi:MAG: peptide-methionine (R)-S-oxide reductase MsrB [Aestuariivirga sp.]